MKRLTVILTSKHQGNNKKFMVSICPRALKCASRGMAAQHWPFFPEPWSLVNAARNHNSEVLKSPEKNEHPVICVFVKFLKLSEWFICFLRSNWRKTRLSDVLKNYKNPDQSSTIINSRICFNFPFRGLTSKISAVKMLKWQWTGVFFIVWLFCNWFCFSNNSSFPLFWLDMMEIRF